MTSKKFSVLICDDSMLVRKKLKESLDKCGCNETLEASDGQTAVEMYKQHKPVLVFMDIVMPVQDGIEALKEIKNFNRQARVVMLSSSGTQTNLKKALEAGASDFIQKPWNQEQIVSIIAKTIKEREEHYV